MRLIDADKLESVDFSECTDSMEIMAIIDAQPTAYYGGKVVEQIKSLSPANYVSKDDVLKIVKCGWANGYLVKDDKGNYYQVW